MKQKLIGIPASRIGETGFGATINYLEFISKFGVPRIIMPWEEYVEVDLLLLPGGMDTNPTNYGEIPSFNAGHIDVFKEFFFKERLKNYIGKTAIFGICLGMQQLGIHFGSKLTQHSLFHAESPDRWQAGHEVRVSESPETKFKINSHHHQYIGNKDLSKELKPLFEADNEDHAKKMSKSQFIIEGFQHKELPIVGLQWHPEEFYDEYSIAIIRNLLSWNE